MCHGVLLRYYTVTRERGEIMKRVLGLFKRELQLHYRWLLALSALTIGVTIGIPFLVKRYIDSTIHVSNVVFIMAAIVSILSFMIVCLQFFTNLRSELNRVDIWLHTQAPFYELILAKVFFSVITSIILTFLMSVEMLVAASTEVSITFFQQIKFLLVMIFLSISLIFSFLPITLLLFTCYVKLKKWIGRFSYMAIVILFFGIIFLFDKIISSSLYRDFFLDGIKTNKWIDTAIEPIGKVFDVSFLSGDYYLREDLLSIVLTVILIIFGVKWCEKVVKE